MKNGLKRGEGRLIYSVDLPRPSLPLPQAFLPLHCRFQSLLLYIPWITFRRPSTTEHAGLAPDSVEQTFVTILPNGEDSSAYELTHTLRRAAKQSTENEPQPRLIEDLEDDNSFDTDDDKTTFKFDRAQRELVTQSVDFSIRSLADMVLSGQIDTTPAYQRRLRWDNIRKSRLIESFLMNVPIPPLFFAEEGYGNYIVIDGQQRLRALADLFTDELELKGLQVFNELNAKRFSQLPIELQNVLTMRPTLRCIIIQRQSDPEIKFEVFERLNTGGVKLNAQEIRNSAYRGTLNEAIMDCSENPVFRRMLKVKDPTRSHIVQYMRDCELVLRFFALKDTWEEFSGPMRYYLNEYMSHNRNPSSDMLATLRREFTETLGRVEEAFGDKAFLRWDKSRKTWSRVVLAAMFDAQMIACYQHPAQKLWKYREGIINDCRDLFEQDEEFAESVIGQTTNAVKVRYRIRKLKQIITQRSA